MYRKGLNLTIPLLLPQEKDNAVKETRPKEKRF
jgi:hypothetical protein